MLRTSKTLILFLLLRSSSSTVDAFSWDSETKGARVERTKGGLLPIFDVGSESKDQLLMIVDSVKPDTASNTRSPALSVINEDGDAGGEEDSEDLGTESETSSTTKRQQPAQAARPQIKLSSFTSSLSASIPEDQESHPLFQAKCKFVATYTTCGDYYSKDEGVDHALFCSPDGVCAGRGAACGSQEACSKGLTCDPHKHRCVTRVRKRLSRQELRIEARRKSATASCPPGSEICPTGHGSFHCVHTDTETTECGACLRYGGRDCHQIENVLASSCRMGECRIHACLEGYEPSRDGMECVEWGEPDKDL